MSRFGTDIRVQGPTGRCAATGQPLEPGSICIATLIEREDDTGFDRLDYSLAAWESGERPERLYSYWKTIVPEPAAKKKLLVDDAVLMDLFERLADDERPQRQAFRFVIGLILMRKRLLKFVGRAERRDSASPEKWLLKPRGSGGDPDSPPIELLNPQLSDDDVRELIEQLSEVLQGEL